MRIMHNNSMDGEPEFYQRKIITMQFMISGLHDLEKSAMKKFIQNFLRVLLIASTLIYALFMPQMSAAGWQYNVNAGNYPEVFAAFATWMRIGSVLLTAACVLCMCGIKPKFWRCNAVSLLCACAGLTSCMTVLYKFCAYADQNFSGIGDTMQPVSELYRDRLLPMLLPFAVCCVLAVWQITSYDVKVYIQQKKEEKQRLDAQEAPSILAE